MALHKLAVQNVDLTPQARHKRAQDVVDQVLRKLSATANPTPDPPSSGMAGKKSLRAPDSDDSNHDGPDTPSVPDAPSSETVDPPSITNTQIRPNKKSMGRSTTSGVSDGTL